MTKLEEYIVIRECKRFYVSEYNHGYLTSYPRYLRLQRAITALINAEEAEPCRQPWPTVKPDSESEATPCPQNTSP